MKKRILSGLLVAAMLLTSLPTAAFAADDTNAEAPDTGETQTILPQSEGDAEQSTVTAPSYEVSTTAELSTALTQIATRAEDEATIVLKDNVTAPSTPESAYVTSFGVAGKHITVKSLDGEMKNISFASRGVLTGDCTFDNVNVTGRRLFCNGYRTIFTENGKIYLSETLYGGGYKRTVDSTYVVIAASGSINSSSSSGLHDVIGGSYQGSVEGDTYLEITGSLQMQGGNHLNPGCVMGDGTSGDGKNSPAVYVGGNATLIYDNPNSKTSPGIEGSYGCEMKGNVTLDIRSGRANEICGTQEMVDKSIIRGDLHIIAGAEKYENTDRTLRLNANWPIVGAGNLFAADPDAVGNYTVGGNITIDTYENVWSWDKGVDPTTDHDKWYDIPEIYGAIRGNVGGSITINAHGSHVENITGASDSSTVGGDVTINATNVELKNYYYEDPDYDEGDILANYESTVTGKCSVNVDGGDVNIVRLTNGKTVNEDSQITITGSPKIRTGVLPTTNYSSTPEYVTVTMTACNATIPFIQSATQVYVKNDSKVTLNGLWLAGDLTVDAGSSLKTDEDIVELTGSAVVNGTWEQLFTGATGPDYDTDVAGTMTIGTSGKYIGHGSTHVAGDVSSCGMMALMKPSEFGGNYAGTNAELRLPAVVTNYTAADIPLKIKGLSTGTTTVNTVDPADWQTLKKPALGDNYILSKKNTDSPAQNVFVLGNADALADALFLKRMPNADGTDDYYMWQVANGVRVIFDKNGGDTEADHRIMVQDKVVGVVNHFELPTTEPTRRGYIFMGWNTKADGTGDAFTAATDVTSNITVYAQWKDSTTYSVTYKDGVDGTVFADQMTAGLHVGDTTPAFSGTPTRSGYTFTGWQPSVAATVTDNAVYTAQWTKNSSSSHHSTRYTLHYESNGGTAYKDERYSSGTKVTLDKTPTRESYTFTGWYADQALTQKITTVTMNSNKTVYAGWEATGVPDKLNGDDHYAYVIGYLDGNVRPNANVSRAETATIFFRLLKSDIRDGNLIADNGFSDVSDGQWHNKAISTMAKLGIVKGRRADNFDPDASITRAEFAAICARFNTKPVENSGSFSDISGHWAENEIERAAAFGWISGYPDGTFRPDARITRAEAMTMINRVLCRMPQSKSDLLDSMVTWPDNKPSDWHYLAVQEATNSHDFDRKGEVGESWTKLTSVPDWKRYQ
nr:S-layer homology domain-containing protein [Butyricicoccus sp. GAM44]